MKEGRERRGQEEKEKKPLHPHPGLSGQVSTNGLQVSRT